jgi:hypothetical protein
LEDTAVAAEQRRELAPVMNPLDDSPGSDVGMEHGVVPELIAVRDGEIRSRVGVDGRAVGLLCGRRIRVFTVLLAVTRPADFDVCLPMLGPVEAGRDASTEALAVPRFV